MWWKKGADDIARQWQNKDGRIPFQNEDIAAQDKNPPIQSHVYTLDSKPNPTRDIMLKVQQALNYICLNLQQIQSSHYLSYICPPPPTAPEFPLEYPSLLTITQVPRGAVQPTRISSQCSAVWLSFMSTHHALAHYVDGFIGVNIFKKWTWSVWKRHYLLLVDYFMFMST